MTTQDEIDEGLLQSVKARKEENPIYWPTPEELAAIDRAVIKQVTSDEAAPPPAPKGWASNFRRKCSEYTSMIFGSAFWVPKGCKNGL